MKAGGNGGIGKKAQSGERWEKSRLVGGRFPKARCKQFVPVGFLGDAPGFWGAFLYEKNRGGGGGPALFGVFLGCRFSKKIFFFFSKPKGLDVLGAGRGAARGRFDALGQYPGGENFRFFQGERFGGALLVVRWIVLVGHPPVVSADKGGPGKLGRMEGWDGPGSWLIPGPADFRTGWLGTENFTVKKKRV